MIVIEAVLPVEGGEEVLALLDGGKALGTVVHMNRRREPSARPTLVRAGVDGAAGSARYILHLTADIGAVADRLGTRAELVDGAPIAMETLRRLA